ncbi:hypothetical protein [Amycolatopsis sp. 195334CR]|uniref:hypothetical protein n=1 Tax=Amycolatopsis sp. 195334CR TaxID=2814588 RepID=UPI001A8EDBD0|nr:hypothetical protein [Amycolatopsis sp. 195334CR]MBN6041192.1 hypothetical protein [Amycolatopsis sp. 195334CR]
MRLPRSIALAAGVLFAVTACTSPDSEIAENITDPDVVKLGETAVAFYLSSDTSVENQAEKRPGYLVLVGADGGTRLVETSGMSEPHLAWSETGLFFSDDSRDYILGKDGLVSFENKKASHQQSAFPLPGGNGFVSVYNDGFSDSGYTNQVAVTTSTGSQLYPVEGNYFMNALCDGVLNGIATEVGTHLPASAAIPGMRSKADPTAEPELLSQLYPATEGQEKVLAWRGAFDAGDHNRHVPCHNGVITFLSDYADADGDSHMTVVSWDTRTGNYTEQPLVDAQGRPIIEGLVDFETFSQKSYDARAVREGHLEWLAADGRIMRTAIASGITEPRFDTGFLSGNDSASQVVFTDRSIHVIQETFDGVSPVKIKRFDRATAGLVTEITVPGLAQQRGIEFNVRGTAVPPTA